MIVFDTETTGLPLPMAAALSKQPAIIEFSAVLLNDKTLKEEAAQSFLIHPGQDISLEITKITGITNEMLKGQPRFGERIPEIVAFFLGQGTVCGHNLEFDCSLLSFDLMRAGQHFRFPWPPRRLCTVELSMSIYGRCIKLVDLYKLATGTEHKGAHRSLSDARATAQCLRWLKTKGMVKL